DAPAAVPGQLSATGGWLRSRARDGLLFLVGAGVRADIAAAAAVPDAPTRVQPVGALDAGGALTSTLGIRPAEVWVVRPDGHVAATLHAPTGAALAAAARRALGFHLPTGAARAGTGEAAADGAEPASRRAAGGTAAAP
ncbi:MAG TPA: hypothetical protein VFY17_03045, partial [Pilimelia sp.]|nr:hypothetical protein [Pilimelia sp.]